MFGTANKKKNVTKIGAPATSPATSSFSSLFATPAPVTNGISMPNFKNKLQKVENGASANGASATGTPAIGTPAIGAQESPSTEVVEKTTSIGGNSRRYRKNKSRKKKSKKNKSRKNKSRRRH